MTVRSRNSEGPIELNLSSLDATPRYIVFQDKQDLEKNLVKRLRGWLLPGFVFVVMRDQSAGDCVAVKKDGLIVVYRPKRKISWFAQPAASWKIFILAIYRQPKRGLD